MATPTDRTDPAAARRTTLDDTAPGQIGERTSLRETELKRHRGGPTLWIVLAVVAAILLALLLFSGAFSSNPEVGADVDGAATDGSVAVPEGSTIDGAPVVDGAPADGAIAPAGVDGTTAPAGN